MCFLLRLIFLNYRDILFTPGLRTDDSIDHRPGEAMTNVVGKADHDHVLPEGKSMCEAAQDTWLRCKTRHLNVLMQGVSFLTHRFG